MQTTTTTTDTTRPALDAGWGRLLSAAFKLSAPILAAYWLIGLGYGIFATRLGLGAWFPVLTAAFVYSGSVEFILASMFVGAFNPLAVFLMAFLVGARHLFYGLSMLERFRGAGALKPLMIALLTDETFAITFAKPPPAGFPPHRFQTLVSLLVWSYWLTGTALGVLLARLLGTFDLAGVEFIMTAMFAAIFAENWRKEARHAGSLVGVGAALLALVLFGADNFMLPAMGFILAALVLLRRRLA